MRLGYHLRLVDSLNPEQIAAYNRLRGYGQANKNGHSGQVHHHHHDRPNKGRPLPEIRLCECSRVTNSELPQLRNISATELTERGANIVDINVDKVGRSLFA